MCARAFFLLYPLYVCVWRVLLMPDTEYTMHTQDVHLNHIRVCSLTHRNRKYSGFHYKYSFLSCSSFQFHNTLELM